MYETYVLDRRNALGIKNIFKESKNLWSYQSIVARMLETIRKNYWKTNKKVIENFSKEYIKTVKNEIKNPEKKPDYQKEYKVFKMFK